MNIIKKENYFNSFKIRFFTTTRLIFLLLLLLTNCRVSLKFINENLNENVDTLSLADKFTTTKKNTLY